LIFLGSQLSGGTGDRRTEIGGR